MTQWLNSTPTAMQSPEVWCLVGNVVREQSTATEKTLHGTKHLSLNTKVFCLRPLWGDGYENIKVIGRHRKSHRNICLIMPSKFITNWRIQKVYEPSVLRLMKEDGWKNKEDVLRMLGSIIKNRQEGR